MVLRVKESPGCLPQHNIQMVLLLLRPTLLGRLLLLLLPIMIVLLLLLLLVLSREVVPKCNLYKVVVERPCGGSEPTQQAMERPKAPGVLTRRKERPGQAVVRLWCAEGGLEGAPGDVLHGGKGPAAAREAAGGTRG